MFTGIVTDIGIIAVLDQQGDLRARITTGYDTAGIDMGASIASDGVCLTVVDLGPDWYDVQISAAHPCTTNPNNYVRPFGNNRIRHIDVIDPRRCSQIVVVFM